MDGTNAPDRAYLDKLEQFLESGESPPNSMPISDLDGFLTGIAVGPELIPPSEWMPVIWGDDEASFVESEQAVETMRAIMRRYDDILHTLSESRWTIAPIYWEDLDGNLVAADWAEGFMDAVRLRLDAWEPLFIDHRKGELLMPILLLCCDVTAIRCFLGATLTMNFY